MKKRWIPIIAIALAATFILGVSLGSTQSNQTHNRPPRPGQATTLERYFNTTIAIVNADVGAEVNSTRYNYSSAIIATLDTTNTDFELVSPAMAQTGFTNGTYGAIITFPPEVSQRILSFNAHQPERVQLEFQINPDLPEREYLELYITITEIQMAINTTLASTYVSSIFRQFHEAQDQVDGVFRNTLADLLALEIITLGDFTATLALDEVPHLPLNPTELNTTFYMEQVTSFAAEVSSWYRNSYAMASDQYLWMREGLLSLTDNFPEQENEWMEMLYMWTGYSIQYGELLEEYSEYVRLHEESLVAWHRENVAWNEALEDYQSQVVNWHEDSNFWFEDAYTWHTEYLGFLDEAVDYYEALSDFHTELEDNIIPLQEDITGWKDDLIDFEDLLSIRQDEILDFADTHNYHAELSNDFAGYLLQWHTQLDAYVYSIVDWKDEVTKRLKILNSWQDEMDITHEELQTVIATIIYDIYNLPSAPTLVADYIPLEYGPAERTIPAAPPIVPGINMLNWAQPTPVPIPPGPTPPPANATLAQLEAFHADLLGWQIALQGASNNLLVNPDSIAVRLASRQGQLQQYASELYNNTRQSLYLSYLTIRDWHDDLNTFHIQFITWDTQLREHSIDVDQWYNHIEIFEHSLAITEVPTIPTYFDWQHLALPYETDLPLPEYVDALEMINLPNWEEELPGPPQYDGTSLIEAFNRNFPLAGNALEPMYLGRPLELTGYHVPDIVPYHDMLLATQPFNPMVGAPPRPDAFWASLGFMHDQLLGFDVGQFLSYDILRMVDHSIQSYDVFLQSVRDDISFLFQDNIWMMHDLHREYDHLLRDIRAEALAANRDEQEVLQDAIYHFATARGYTHEDTHYRLGTFAGMMPESRAVAGVNQELIGFTVMPFDFVPLELRNGVSAQPAATSDALTASTPSLTDMIQHYQTIILIALGGVFIGTVISFIISHFSQKKRTEAEARGFI